MTFERKEIQAIAVPVTGLLGSKVRGGSDRGYYTASPFESFLDRYFTIQGCFKTSFRGKRLSGSNTRSYSSRVRCFFFSALVETVLLVRSNLLLQVIHSKERVGPLSLYACKLLQARL